MNNYSKLEEPECVMHLESHTRVVINKKELGVGTLYDGESVLLWKGPQSFCIKYSQVCNHSYSIDISISPSDYLCLKVKYFQLYEGEDIENGTEINVTEEPTEVTLIMQDAPALWKLYKFIKHRIELNTVTDLTDDDDVADLAAILNNDSLENDSSESDGDRSSE